MPDITEELRRMTDDGAYRARPMAVAEVIHRGNRRRSRSIVQRSIGGLSVVGVSAALIFTGTASGQGGTAAASGAAPAGTTLTQTVTSPAGSMTIDVRYQAAGKGKIKLDSFAFSGNAKTSAKHAVLILRIGPIVPPAVGPRKSPGNVVIFSIHLDKNHSFSGSTPRKLIVTINKHLTRNDPLSMTLATSTVFPKKPSLPKRTVRLHPLLTLGTILSQLP
jgi:hypothetical protein